MKIHNFSVIERYFQYFLLFIVLGIVIDSIYYFNEFGKQINPFYINLFVAISLFSLSLLISKWRSDLDNSFPQREELYRNLSKLIHLYDKSPKPTKSDELFSNIISLYVFTGRPLGGETEHKIETPYINLDGIQFSCNLNQLEENFYDKFSNLKFDISQKIDDIYRKHNPNDDSQFSYFHTKNIEDINEDIENCFKSRLEDEQYSKFIQDIESLLLQQRRNIRDVLKIKSKIVKYHIQIKKKIEQYISALEKLYNSRLMRESKFVRDVYSNFQNINNNFEDILKRIDELNLDSTADDIDELRNEISDIRELGLSIKEKIRDIESNRAI